MRLITTAAANVEEIQCWIKLEMVVWVFTFYRKPRKVLERTKKKDEGMGTSIMFGELWNFPEMTKIPFSLF